MNASIAIYSVFGSYNGAIRLADKLLLMTSLITQASSSLCSISPKVTRHVKCRSWISSCYLNLCKNPTMTVFLLKNTSTVDKCWYCCARWNTVHFCSVHSFLWLTFVAVEIKSTRRQKMKEDKRRAGGKTSYKLSACRLQQRMKLKLKKNSTQ